MLQERERIVQIARLAGGGAFAARFGSPQTASPAADDLAAFIEERLDAIARSLVEEAAASDDVTDAASASAYLADRLAALAFEAGTADRLRAAFRKDTAEW